MTEELKELWDKVYRYGTNGVSIETQDMILDLITAEQNR